MSMRTSTPSGPLTATMASAISTASVPSSSVVLARSGRQTGQRQGRGRSSSRTSSCTDKGESADYVKPKQYLPYESVFQINPGNESPAEGLRAIKTEEGRARVEMPGVYARP